MIGATPAAASAAGPIIDSREAPMLKLAVLFLIIAVVAAALGFGGIFEAAKWAAGVLFVVGLVLLAFHLLTGRGTSV